MKMLVLVLLAACGAKAAPQPSPSNAPPQTKRTGEQAEKPATVRSDQDQAFDKMQGFADSMCQCKTSECARKLSGEMTKWADTTSKVWPQMTEADAQRAQGIGKRMGTCMVAALKMSPEGSAQGLAVTGVDPRMFASAGGTNVHITGSGFQSQPRTARVYFGDEQGKVVKIQSDTEMIVEAPAEKPGDVTVLVVFEPGGEVTFRGVLTYE